jgi:sec-independent protein translocase protein TatA
MPGFIGVPELLLLALVALLLFGPKRLPEMGRGLGKGMREFKDSVTGNDRPDEPAGLPPSTTTATSAPARENEHTS